MKKKKINIDFEAIEPYYSNKKIKHKNPKPLLPIMPTNRLWLKDISKTETKIFLEVFGSPPFEPFVLLTYNENTKSFSYKKKGLLRFVIINTFFAFIIVIAVLVLKDEISIGFMSKLKFIAGCLAFASIFLFGLGKLHYFMLAKLINKQVTNSQL